MSVNDVFIRHTGRRIPVRRETPLLRMPPGECPRDTCREPGSAVQAWALPPQPESRERDPPEHLEVFREARSCLACRYRAPSLGCWSPPHVLAVWSTLQRHDPLYTVGDAGC